MTLQDQIDGAVPAALFEEIADLCSLYGESLALEGFFHYRSEFSVELVS